MSALADMVTRRLRLMIDSRLTSAEAHARVGEIARASLAQLIASGEASEDYERVVDGVVGAREETVALDGGLIEYRFSKLGSIVDEAVRRCAEYSPRESGDFASSWFVVVDGEPWAGGFDDIPSRATVYVTNFAPYARHIEEGWETRRRARGTSYASGRPTRGKQFKPARARYQICERVSSEMREYWPSALIEKVYITLPGSASVNGWQVPYIRRTGEERGESILYPGILIAPRK